jgi:hypothetical protein
MTTPGHALAELFVDMATTGDLHGTVRARRQ